ncbi:MAG: sulfatase [Phycisphaerae bacterium]|jgi:arylsulfatase A-like enzyme|nr:sulfatase [Phycisphaerae bacterium]
MKHTTKTDRRGFLKLIAAGAAAASLTRAGFASVASKASKQTKYNVLFLAVDDLNDWVGCLAGHPQAKTPNIDKLAGKGVLFEQAYCAAPLCNPSRTSVMTGLHPTTTGIYGNRTWFRDHPKFKDAETIPQYFRKHGYAAQTGGKIFHQAHGKYSDPISWDKQYSTNAGTPKPLAKKRYLHGMKFPNPIVQRLVDWAPIKQTDKETNDWKTANLAAKFLQRKHDKPFFLGCGIYRPHLSWYAPKKYFDMHPLDKVQLPVHKADDLDDVPTMGRRMAGDSFNTIKKHGQWKKAVQGYLAACSFADACVGHVLDALDNSEYRDNTIVVLWGDHGYHIGEKNHFSKSALWAETSRTPLIIYVPGGSKRQTRCRRPVSLIDIYPTLVELCGLPDRDGLDGRSLAPLVRNPGKDWPYPALISHCPFWYGANHAIHSQRYHYIHYRDGGEELYDNIADPYGWKNLADDPKYAEAKANLKKWLPKVTAEHFRAPIAPKQPKPER